MKYAITISKENYKSETLNDYEEVIILYNSVDNTLFEYLALHKNSNQRIIIAFEKELPTENLLVKLAQINSENSDLNLTLKFYRSAVPEETRHRIEDLGLLFFYSDFCRSWDCLNGWIGENVSDIYIVEEMGFDLKRIGRLCHLYNISVRVFPNIAQSEYPNSNIKFFIRPNDVKFYEDYVDVFEFMPIEQRDSLVYRKIYTDGNWYGDLKEIIIGEEWIPNEGLSPDFGEARIGCGKRCAKGNGCTYCVRAILLARDMYKHNISFDKESD